MLLASVRKLLLLLFFQFRQRILFPLLHASLFEMSTLYDFSLCAMGEIASLGPCRGCALIINLTHHPILWRGRLDPAWSPYDSLWCVWHSRFLIDNTSLSPFDHYRNSILMKDLHQSHTELPCNILLKLTQIKLILKNRLQKSYRCHYKLSLLIFA